MIYDVIVVGAGSNGSTAAYFLAKEGFKTLLIERAKTPGDKCHGATEYCPGVIFYTMPELVRLQLRVIRQIPHLHPGDIGSAHCYYYVDRNNQVVFKSMAKAPGKTGRQESYGLHNQDFVRVLAQEAVKAGATLQTSTTVVDIIREGNAVKGVITERGEQYRARLTIAADGRLSTIAKKAGLLKKWDPNIATYHYGEAWKFRSEEEMFEYVEHARHMFFGPTLIPENPWGASTIALRPGGIVTVNVPTAWTPLSSLLNEKKSSRHSYIQNLYEIMEVKRMLRVCKGFPDKPYQRQSCFMPGPPLKKPYMAGLLICGDAGGVGSICLPGYKTAKFVVPLLKEDTLSEEVLSGYINERSMRTYEESEYQSKKHKSTKELSRVSPTRLVHWSSGAGYMEQYGCSMEAMIENMRLAAIPHVMGAPSPEKCGEFGYREMGAWIVAIKINHLLKLYGPIIQDPEIFPKILQWIQKNEDSFNKTKVFDHPF